MAAWQFDLITTTPDGSRVLPEDFRVRVESFLHGLLPANIEGSGWTMYGTDTGNRIDLNFDKDGCEVSIRVDARSDAESFLGLVALLADSLGCELLCDELQERVATDVACLKEALQRSSAWRYAISSNR